jgi:photosystem II stability/assembly factor-like uncharacterized protein
LAISKEVNMMRRFLSIAFFLWGLCFISPSHAQDSLVWVTQTNSVTQDLWSVHFVDTLHGWAAGNYGAVLRTVNGGQTWSRCTFSSTDTINTIFFIDPSHGWMAGNRGIIYVSNDSGLTWAQQYSRAQTYLAGAWFIDTLTGFFVGGGPSYKGTIIRTTNGGQTWTPTDLSTPWGFSSVMFVDATHGWATGNDYVVPTTNSGAAWGTAIDPLSSYKGYVNKAVFIDTQKGFGIGRYGGITGTINGGQNWFAIDTSSGAWLEGISFADPQHGVIVGERGVVCWSADSGKTWQHTYPHHQPTIDALWFRSVQFVDAQHGWAVGDGGLIIKGAFSRPIVTGCGHAVPAPAFCPAPFWSNLSGILSLVIPSGYAGKVLVNIYNVAGVRLYQAPVMSAANTVKLDLHWLPAGVYGVAITIDGQNIAQWLIVRTQ